MAVSLTPLSSRVSAPAAVPLPTHPDIAHWRPSTADDVDEIHALLRACDRVDHPNFLTTRAEIADDYGISFFDPARDTLLGFTADGALVALGRCWFPPNHETLVRSILQGGVHPEWRGRGIGQVLLDWQIGRGKQQLASSDKLLPGWLVVDADERAPQNTRLFERAGFAVSRYFLALERALADPIRSFDLVGGVRIEPYRPELSAEVHAVRNASFGDHWGSQPVADETWAAFIGSEVFRADLSFVAIAPTPAGERVVGFIMTTVTEGDWAEQGFTGSYIALVGVLKLWRGRRIAQALLAAELAADRAAGHERTTLDVDSDSPTGALGLYAGMGFTASHREVSHVMVF